MTDFRPGMVLTFDQETRGALVVEQTDQLAQTVQKWIEKTCLISKFTSPSRTRSPVIPYKQWSVAQWRGWKKPKRRWRNSSALSSHGAKDPIRLRDLSMLDVLHSDCSKGRAVERWAKQQGVPRDEIMCIGDNFNDVEMLEFAGWP